MHRFLVTLHPVRIASFTLLAAALALSSGVAQASAPCNQADSAGGGIAGVSPGANLGWDVGSGQCNGSFTVTDVPGFAGGHLQLGIRAEERTAGQVARVGANDYTVNLGTDLNQPNVNRAWWNFQPSIAYNGSIDNLDSLTLTIIPTAGSAPPVTPTRDLLAAGVRTAIDDRNTNGTTDFSDLYQISQNPLFGWLNGCTTNAQCTTGVCTNPFGAGMCLDQEAAWLFKLTAKEGADTAEVTICIHTPGADCSTIPTLSEWGIIGMALVMFGGLLYLNRRRAFGTLA